MYYGSYLIIMIQECPNPVYTIKMHISDVLCHGHPHQHFRNTVMHHHLFITSLGEVFWKSLIDFRT